jgi:hypothetical protein
MQVGEEGEHLQIGLCGEGGLEIAGKLGSDLFLLLIRIVRAIVEADGSIGLALTIKDSLDIATASGPPDGCRGLTSE